MITSDVKQGAYEAPTSVTLELSAEGVLCESGNVSINDFGRDDSGLEC